MEALVSKIFSCSRCGYCCQGETTVSLDNDDQKRMVSILKLSKDEVKRKFWRLSGNVVQMKVVDGHCIFYKNGCKVHEGRPHRCAQWPLHPSLLQDENNLKTIRESCPGINQKISYKDFCSILKQLIDSSYLVY